MRNLGERIPEGGAIEDGPGMSAEDYGNLMYSRLKGEYERFAECVLEKVDPSMGATVLEIGPGPGWAGLMLLKRRPDLRLVGLDASPDMVRAAAANAAGKGAGDRASYRVGTAEELQGIADGSVDLVISRDSLHHWSDPSAAFASALRVLKPSGELFLRDERRDISPGAWAFVYIFGGLSMGGMARYWRSSIRAGYTSRELRAFLPDAGKRAWGIEEGFLDLTLILTGEG